MYDAVDRQIEEQNCVVWCKSCQKRGRGMLMVIWTAGLDVPRHTTAEPERWGLAAAAGSRTSKEAWRHGTALVLPASSHANRPCCIADLGRPRQDGQARQVI